MFAAITQVWGALATFFQTLYPTIVSFFWDATANENAGALTFPGVLACVMAGVALLLLVFNLIRSFLPMRA